MLSQPKDKGKHKQGERVKSWKLRIGKFISVLFVQDFGSWMRKAKSNANDL